MSTVTSTVYPYVVHIISIIALLGGVLGINYFFFVNVKGPDDIQIMFWAFSNIAYGVGMSYYLANVSVTSKGFNETTTAASPQQ